MAARANHRCVTGMVCNPPGRQQFPVGVARRLAYARIAGVIAFSRYSAINFMTGVPDRPDRS
ncbi:MAG TPA: hypothetical protein VJ255_10235, partial [Candidatus Acidoferrum sp.]|nr:hypothetical protein [Candidatus Acidoferrum sp.]